MCKYCHQIPSKIVVICTTVLFNVGKKSKKIRNHLLIFDQLISANLVVAGNLNLGLGYLITTVILKTIDSSFFSIL